MSEPSSIRAVYGLDYRPLSWDDVAVLRANPALQDVADLAERILLRRERKWSYRLRRWLRG